MTEFHHEIQDREMKQNESKWTYAIAWGSVALIIVGLYLASKYFGF